MHGHGILGIHGWIPAGAQVRSSMVAPMPTFSVQPTTSNQPMVEPTSVVGISPVGWMLIVGGGLLITWMVLR
jgi:hypothetical protein